MTFEDYCEKSGLPGWIFEVVVPEKIRNIKYIHPLKQRDVVKLVKIAMKSDDINSVRVFGSSITDDCYFNSDLDICIDWTFDCYDSEGVIVPRAAAIIKQFSILTHGNIDIVHFKYLKGTVVEKDAKKGVIVYERGDQYV